MTADRTASSRFDAESTRRSSFYTGCGGASMTTGVDVSKDELVYCTRTTSPRSAANSADGVAVLLDGLPSDAIIAMEATGRYYRLLADTAHARGFQVIVHNPKDVSKYAKSVSPRAATDPIMAKVIAEFTEIREHRFYDPTPSFVDTLKNLVRTRAGLVKDRVSLQNRAAEHCDIATYLAQASQILKQSIDKLDEQIADTAKTIPQYSLLIKTPGFGPLVTAYLIALLSSGTFQRSDSFVAFIGLDLRVRESGKLKGKRKLSKRGDPEARRLLYLAAFAACRAQSPFRELYEHYIGKGFSKTEATVFVARKLARVAWSIYKHNQPYIPGRVRNQPTAPIVPGQHTQITATLQHAVAPPTKTHTPVHTTNTRKKRTKAIDSTT
jgi:transposase